MCNRYRVAADYERLRGIFQNAPQEWFSETERTYLSFYPKSKVPVYLKVNGDDYFGHFQWGIVPDWAKTKSQVLTNTKSEEALKKPTWSESFRRRRCLMPATSFFEPARVGGVTHQMEFSLKDGSAFAFPGIWQRSTKFGDERNTCSLLTCEPNELVGEVHGRMPCILRPEHFETYLTTPAEQAEDLLDLLLPYPAEEMTARVNDEKEVRLNRL